MPDPANQALVLTPPGSAAIAVIRLIGPGVAGFLQTHFSRPARAGRCVHGELRQGERVIDDPVVVLLPEDAGADLNLHGGPWVVRATLDLARQAGFQVHELPGLPLPADAVDSSSELEQEILTHLPLARTELAVRTLLAQGATWAPLIGRNGKAVKDGERAGQWSIETEEILTTPHPHTPTSPHRNKAAILKDPSLHWLLHPPRVAIVGAANVGKSTLANRLFAQERSITADLPGTTRDWVGEMADIDGLAVVLVDTPGLRATSDRIEQAAIDRGREQIDLADLVVLVLDGTRPLDEEQGPLVAIYPEALRVINKVDRPAAWAPPWPGAIRTVATTGQGIEDLRRAIAGHFGCDAMDLSRPRSWTERQRRWLESPDFIP